MEKLDISVLYVEDQILILRSFGNILKRRINDVFTATNGREGLEVYKQHRQDIIITDINMPVMNGIEMVKEIKAINPAIPVILLSAFDNKEYLLDAIRLRVNGFISKPVDADKLVDLVEELTETIHLKKQVEIEENERKKIQEMLEESKEKYRSLYQMLRMMCDNVPDMIWAKNMENQYIFTNKAMCEKLLMAKDTNEPVGKTDMFFAMRERESHREDPKWHTFGEICRDSDDVVKKKRKEQRFGEYGNVQGKFMFLDVNKAPFLNEKGEVIGTVGCGRIVTNEKEKLAAEEKK